MATAQVASSSSSASSAAAANSQPTLRVMRLYRPRLWKDAIGGVAGVPRLTQSLALPDSFGNIYRGERFSAYVSVLNPDGELSEILKDVTVSAKLQAPTAKRAIELADTSEERRSLAGLPPSSSTDGVVKRKRNPAGLLTPGENVDMIVEHTLEELGTHTLRVSVSYRDSRTDAAASSLEGDEEPPELRSLRKFYRFNVLEPIVVESVAWKLPAGSRSDAARRASSVDELTLGVVQVTLRNAMHARALLDAPVLHPPPGFVTRALLPESTQTVDDDPVRAFDAQCHLEPGESLRRLFAVQRTPRASDLLTGDLNEEEQEDPHHQLAALRDAGWLKVSWLAAMGDGGSIVTPPISWKRLPSDETSEEETPTVAPRSLVEVELQNLPPKRCFKLGVVTSVTSVVRNRSERDLSLQLQWRLAAMPKGVQVDGMAFQNLGLVRAGASAKCTVNLRPTETGLFSMTGCHVLDVNSAHEFPQPSLAEVLVER